MKSNQQHEMIQSAGLEKACAPGVLGLTNGYNRFFNSRLQQE
jgi:hypothetical protein